MAPRYPGLTSRTRGLPKRYDLIQPYVLSAYRRSTARAFWSSAAMAEVNRWYAHATWAHFAISNAPVADLRIYHPRHTLPGHMSWLEIALVPSRGGTTVQYWANEVIAPPRPTNTYLSASFVQVMVTVTRQTHPFQVRTVKVTTPTIIARLVHLVNGLRWGRTLGPMPGPTMGGFPIVAETATLVFRTQTGRHVTVFTTNKTGSVRVDGIELGDLQQRVLRAALAMVSSKTLR